MKDLRYLILVPIAVLLTFYIGIITSTAPFFILSLALAFAIGLITFHKPENGLLVIIFSMLLSPEITLADVPGRPLTIRVDDLIIIVVFVAWLANIAIAKDWVGFVKTPIDKPLLFLIFLYIVSSGHGILTGALNPLKTLFYTLKYVEYFVLYWTVVNIISSREIVSKYLTSGLITCIIVTVFAYSLFGSGERVFAPFDTEGGEPASLGGYFLIVYSILLGFLLHTESTKSRILCIAMMIFMFPPFIKTLSRASYIAFIPMVVTILILTKKKKMMLGGIIIFTMIAFPLIFRGLYLDMTKRITTTFTGSHSSNFSSVKMGGKNIRDQSALERIESWKSIVKVKFTRSPITMMIGNGITGVGFVDGQFFLILGELGLLGVITFYWIIIKILKVSYRIYLTSNAVVSRSLSLALLGSVVALTFQSFTTNTFIIVRVMEPFWFLTAIVMTLPSIYNFENEVAYTS